MTLIFHETCGQWTNRYGLQSPIVRTHITDFQVLSGFARRLWKTLKYFLDYFKFSRLSVERASKVVPTVEISDYANLIMKRNLHLYFRIIRYFSQYWMQWLLQIIDFNQNGRTNGPSGSPWKTLQNCPLGLVEHCFLLCIETQYMNVQDASFGTNVEILGMS